MVEFCGHIIFHNAKSNISCPIQRATHSCVEIGSSVIIYTYDLSIFNLYINILAVHHFFIY